MHNLEFIRKRFEKGNIFFNSAEINPETGILRVEQPLVNGQGKYNFDISKGSGQGITEKKLERNDLFIVTALMIYLKVEDASRPGTGVLTTYPAPIGATGFPTTDIEAFYNGLLQIKTGQTVNYEGIPNTLFRHVPESQLLEEQLAEFDVKKHAYYLPEELTFCGTKTHTISTEFPSFPTANYGANTSLVFVAYGYLVKNGCTVSQVGNRPNPYLGL